MTKKVISGYECSICHKIHARDVYAVACEQSHEVVYVPFKSEDLFRLLQFIMTKDDSLITDSLLDTLNKYRNRNFSNRE